MVPFTVQGFPVEAPQLTDTELVYPLTPLEPIFTGAQIGPPEPTIWSNRAEADTANLTLAR